MKKTLCVCFFVCLLLAVLPMFSSAAITASGETPAGFSWTLTDDGTLTVSGNGALDASPWSGNWPDITRIVVEEGITSLREMAFAHCRCAEEIILPETVVEIGARAFSHCEALKSITVPSGVKRLGAFAFEYCSALTTVTAPGELKTGGWGCFYKSPVSKLIVTGKTVTANLTSGFDKETLTGVVLAEGVNEIGERAFSGLQNLAELSLPKTLRIIGDYAFNNCSALKSVTVPPGVKRIGAYAFSGCSSLAAVTAPGDFETEDWEHLFFQSPVSKLTVTGKKVTRNLTGSLNSESITGIVLEEGLTEIEDLAGFCNVTEITLPKTLKSIGKGAFSSWTSLKSLALPDSLTQIGEAAFYDCSALTRIDLPAGIKTIEKDTFYNCSGLKKVSFPGGLVSVGECAFRYCTSLTALQFGAGLKEIGLCAFEGCTSLKTLQFGEGLEKIGSTAFGDCSALTRIELPAGLRTIESYAFHNCSGLKTVNFPGGLVSVGGSAFAGCTALAGLDLPAGLKTIGNGAFSSCTALAVVSLPDSLDRLGDCAFSNCTALKTVRMPIINKTDKYDSTFRNCPITKLTLSGKVFTSEALNYIDVSSVATLVLEPGFTEIGENAFSGFSSMTRCEIGEGVVTIGSYTFSDCGQLSSLTLPKGLETIEEHAFAHCQQLSSLTLPEGLKTLGDHVFEDCESLQSVTLPASVTTLGWQFDMPKIIRTRRSIVYPDYSRKPTLTTEKTGFGYSNGLNITAWNRVTSDDPVTLLSPDNELYAACGFYTDTVSLVPRSGGGTVTFTKKGFTCGAALIGSDGKLYLLWGSDDFYGKDIDETSNAVNVIVSRYERSGKELAACRIPIKESLAASPFDAGNAALIEHNGTLFVLWNTLWISGHQGLERAAVRMRDMKLLDLNTNVGSHSFGVAAIETGRGVAYVHNTDGFPRGMPLAEAELTADGYVSSKSVMAFTAPGQYGTNQQHLDGNRTYHSFITLARSRSTFAAACYGTDVYTSDVFKWSPLYETARYDVYVRILDESLSTNAASDCAGSVRKNEKDGSVADRNLVRLTKLSREEEVNNLQVVTLPSGAYCVLWNQNSVWDSEEWKLHYAVLDERGNILKADTALTGAAMCDYNVGPVVIGSKLVWAYCDAGKLTWATLDLGVDTVSQFLLGDVDLDGSVTAADARLALRGAVGLENYKSGSAAFKAADADRDKKLTAGDARLILRAAVGLETLA